MSESAVTTTGPAPVLLVNALGQGCEPWARLRARLSRRHTTLWSPDLALSGSEQVDALVRLLQGYGRPLHLLGWCTGPKTVLRAAARRRDLVASLTFLNPSFKGPGRPPEVDTAYEVELAGLLRAVHGQPRIADRLIAVLRAQRAAGGASQVGIPDELRESSGLPFLDTPNLLAYAAQHLDFWADDPLADAAVRDLDVPLTVICGAVDVVVAPADVRTVAARFAQAKVEVVDAGHFALHTHAAEVARVIETHLDAVEAAVPAGQ
jgi:pimeloyl-ACP methyl ester carboxylesterase